ncbi:unnamed protein product [Calypogeia fissa]
MRGGSNWAKHLFKQLHHDLQVAKTAKKCRAGSHIRIIFLALEREKKQSAKEDAPLGFPTPQGTKVILGYGMTTPAGGAKSAMRGAAGAKAKPPPKKIIVKAKPSLPNPRQTLGIKVKPPQKDKPEVAAPSPDGQQHPPSPTKTEVQVALEPLPLFNRGEALGAHKKRRASKGKRSSSQETTSKGVNSKPERSQNPEDYPEYIRKVLRANEGECEDTLFEKMCQVTTKSFYQGLIDSLYPQVHRHSAELLWWSRFMAKEIGKLHDQEDKDELKCKRLQETVDRLSKEMEGNKQSLVKEVLLERNIASKAAAETKRWQEELEKEKRNSLQQAGIILAEGDQIRHKDTLLTQKDNEIQVLTHTSNNFKAIIDSNDKELMELDEERDEAVLDAANATSKVEALTKKIKELKGKLSALRSGGNTPNKRPCDT